mmetsp:Transcript_10229/g.29066  ORF Transcript_10229/g.29066 Transcript_10229/m.29066 type:complete len:163 (+) Transcript_10229:105-593(+)
MAAAQQDAANEGSGDEAFTIVYVREKVLKELRENVKDGKEITKDAIDGLTAEKDVSPEEMMVPVDMEGLEDLDDMDALITKLGAKGVAEAFIKAEDRFKANKSKMPADSAPEPMTAKEWKELAEQAELEDMEEESMMEGEEEEELEEEGGDAEPAAKKAKTS